MGLVNHVEQILNLYNYYDGAITVDRAGIIRYYQNKRTDINTLTEKTISGRSIFEVYPSINSKNSTLMEVMRTGMPLNNMYQSMSNFKGEKYSALCNTYPIFEGEKIVGAIEIFQYMEDIDKYMKISLQSRKDKEPQPGRELQDIVSVSDEMDRLKEHILKAAQSRSPVIICGETGTGKELVARALHSSGPRSSGRFVSQNCAAIPENLLESILFGTVKGSFTGSENRKGLFEVASGGTLFLDEINSMDMAVQAKILRAVEEQKIIRIGGTDEIPIDVRIVTASNADPAVCVEKGQMREDLYYRLKVVQLEIPPLRRRKEDIVPIAMHYMDFYNRTMGKNIKGIKEELLTKLREYSWPGNVRELRNMIEGGFNLCDEPYLGLDSLDLYSRRALERLPEDDGKKEGCGQLTLKEKVRSFEREIIIRVIAESENLSRAAEKMGITRQTLNNKIKELKISGSELDKNKVDG